MSSRAWAGTILLTCVAGAIATGVFGVAVAPALFVAGAILSLVWLVFDPWLRQNLTGRKHFKTEEITTDTTRALVLSLEEERWTGFQHRARILRIRVAIRNRTATPISFDGAQWRNHLQHPTEPDGKPILGLAAEVNRVEREHGVAPSTVPENETVYAYFAISVVYNSEMGEPEYEFIIHSQLGGHEYGFRRLGNPKKPIPVKP